MKLAGTEVRAAKYTDGPNQDGYYTAGIDAAYVNFRREQDWHSHAIEFHHKDKATAEARRDAVMTALARTEED